MSALKTAIAVLWVVFGIYWIVSAFGAKRGSRTGRLRAPGLIVIVAFLLLRLFGAKTLAVHSVVLEVIGTILLVSGFALAVWARIYLGRNWGMPMTQKEEPELVTSGPYQLIRHPIDSGLLLAMLGTALATNIYWLIAFGILGVYFIYSATVEEKLLTVTFPTTYPHYRETTKMLIPFVL